jgi:integrase
MREQAGSFAVVTLAQGHRAFHLRFKARGKRQRVILHERPGCVCGCGGGWNEPAARTELGNIIARVRVGVWEPPEALLRRDEVTPTFAEYAQWWLQAKLDGVLGGKPLAKNSEKDLRWRLGHLLAFFGNYPLDQIDASVCLAFKAHKLRIAREQREAIEAGADLRDVLGRKLKPLGAASLRKLLSALAAILEDAIEDGHLDRNGARGRRMRVRVPKPDRTFLEMDELACLLDAAAAQDRRIDTDREGGVLPLKAAIVAQRFAQGETPGQIAQALGLSKSTVSYHLRRAGADVGRGYIGRKIVCEILGRSGVRVSELCELKIGQLRLHDPDGAHFNIPDAKTHTGIREVQMTPDLVEAVIEHIDLLRRCGRSTGPENYLAQNTGGGQLSRQRAGEIVRDAAAQASRELAGKGRAPLPRTTPHSLRRTYISIVLLANNFDVKWVMSQVGHADSKMTLDVYAQLEQRADRRHGASFDGLVRKARDRFAALPEQQAAPVGTSWPQDGHDGEKPTKTVAKRPRRELSKSARTASLQRVRGMARPGLEPGTPRFSVVCSTS